jgi:alkylation response protein AidB-like acyl-CoA dehydrogenase
MWSSIDLTRPVGQLVLDQAPVDLMPEAAGADLVDAALVLVASDAHGGALRMVEDIVQYSKDRVQFDRPIGQFQAVKHKLADLATNVEMNGPLYRQAAAMLAQESEGASLAASIAKSHLTDVFSSTARIATESYGGIGYTWEHHAHIWLRRAMFDYAWMGTPTAQRRRSAELSGW